MQQSQRSEVRRGDVQFSRESTRVESIADRKCCRISTSVIGKRRHRGVGVFRGRRMGIALRDFHGSREIKQRGYLQSVPAYLRAAERLCNCT